MLGHGHVEPPGKGRQPHLRRRELLHPDRDAGERAGVLTTRDRRELLGAMLVLNAVTSYARVALYRYAAGMTTPGFADGMLQAAVVQK